MKMHSAQNERIKRAYFIYLTEAQGFSESTLDAVAKSLNRFETYTKFRDFKAFHIEQAQGFKANLAEQMSLRTKEPLSKATLYATAGVREYWVVDLGRRAVVVHRQSQGQQYRSVQIYSENERVSIEGRAESVRVTDLLPQQT